MELGRFSVSLAVKDLPASRTFYEALGFVAVPAEGSDGHWASYGRDWLILRSGEAIVGLFQGMFDDNILTFNPTDVRAIQRTLKERGVALTKEADESTEGPESVLLQDPDGNTILLDQH